jgi:hypothetical protein
MSGILFLPASSFTHADMKRVADGARTRDLKNHNPPKGVARCSSTGQSTHIRAEQSVWQQPATAGELASVVYLV